MSIFDRFTRSRSEAKAEDTKPDPEKVAPFVKVKSDHQDRRPRFSEQELELAKQLRADHPDTDVDEVWTIYDENFGLHNVHEYIVETVGLNLLIERQFGVARRLAKRGFLQVWREVLRLEHAAERAELDRKKREAAAAAGEGEAEGERQESSQQTKQEDGFTEKVDDILTRLVRNQTLNLLTMVMPNGKALGDLTGAECTAMSKQVGGWLGDLGKNVRPDQLIRDGLTAEQVNAFYDLRNKK